MTIVRQLTVGCCVLLTACGGKSAENAGGDEPADTPSGSGTTGTGSGTTGFSSDGGTTGAPEPTPAPPDVLDIDESIADAPDGAAAFSWRHGIGNWFLSSESGISDAPVDAIEPPREQSTQAVHVSDADREPGVDVWAQLDHPMGRPINLTGYAGLSFWARLRSPDGELGVAFGMSGDFIDSDAPRVLFPINEDWTHVELSFDSIDFDLSAIPSIDFLVGAGGGSFDLWIDELSLVCRETCP